MKSTRYLLTEFFLLFILLPISFAFSYPIIIKAVLTIIGFVYVIVVLRTIEGLSFKVKKTLDWGAYWRRVLTIFAVVALTTAAFVYFSEPGNLFYVPRTDLQLFVIILFIYTFLSFRFGRRRLSIGRSFLNGTKHCFGINLFLFF